MPQLMQLQNFHHYANLDDTHTYSLVTGDGADDNGNFSIYNNELRVNLFLVLALSLLIILELEQQMKLIDFLKKHLLLTLLKVLHLLA